MASLGSRRLKVIKLWTSVDRVSLEFLELLVFWISSEKFRIVKVEDKLSMEVYKHKSL